MLALLCLCVATEFSAKKGLYNVCLMSHCLICVCLSPRVRVHLFGTNEPCGNGWTDRNAGWGGRLAWLQWTLKVRVSIRHENGQFRRTHTDPLPIENNMEIRACTKSQLCHIPTYKGLCGGGGGADRRYHQCSSWRELPQKRGRSQSAGALVFIVKYILSGVANNGINITLWRVEPVAIVRRF